MSTEKADRFEAFNLLDAANILCKSQEKKMKERSNELQRKKAELKSNEALRSNTLSDLKSTVQHANNLKYAKETGETALQKIKAEVESLKEVENMDTDLCRSYMDSVQMESQCLAQKFVSAPQRYHMKTIVQDIQIHMKEEEELESIIQQEYEPEIAVSASRMENEPVVVLETPDTLPTEMTANEMKIIISKLKEDIQRLEQKLQKLSSKKLDLEREEATL